MGVHRLTKSASGQRSYWPQELPNIIPESYEGIPSVVLRLYFSLFLFVISAFFFLTYIDLVLCLHVKGKVIFQVSPTTLPPEK